MVLLALIIIKIEEPKINNKKVLQRTVAWQMLRNCKETAAMPVMLLKLKPSQD